MAKHHFGDGLEVGRTSGTGFHEGGDLAEIFGAENAGRDDCERSRGGRVKIVEAVADSAGDEEDIAGADLGGDSVEGHGEDAFEAVDGLVISVVGVRGGYSGSCADFELKERERGPGGRAIDEKADDDLADANFFRSTGGHAYRCPL